MALHKQKQTYIAINGPTIKPCCRIKGKSEHKMRAINNNIFFDFVPISLLTKVKARIALKKDEMTTSFQMIPK